MTPATVAPADRVTLSPSLAPFLARAVEADALARLVEGLRSFLRATTVEEVVGTCCAVVRGVKGQVVPARLAGVDALPMDLSFGHGEPLLAVAPTREIRLILECMLPDLLEDARVAVAAVRRSGTLSEEATVDGLTGLINRRSVDRLLARIRAGDAVVLMDLDLFKEVNDQLGHAAGDVVLTSFARLLREHGRAGDWFGRLGGDEFIAILPATDPHAAGIVVRRLRAAWLTVRPQPITFSAGVARSEGQDAAAVLARADEALYRSKAARHRHGTSLATAVA